MKALVYSAAMAPDEGETVRELLHRRAPHASVRLVPDEDAFLWMSAKGFADGSLTRVPQTMLCRWRQRKSLSRLNAYKSK